MRRSLSSLILLLSLVLGGLVGPTAHLVWMGMEPGAHAEDDQSELLGVHDTHGGHAITHSGSTDSVGLVPGEECEDECLFLSLLASQASGTTPSKETNDAKRIGEVAFASPDDQIRITDRLIESVRGPPALI